MDWTWRGKGYLCHASTTFVGRKKHITDDGKGVDAKSRNEYMAQQYGAKYSRPSVATDPKAGRDVRIKQKGQRVRQEQKEYREMKARGQAVREKQRKERAKKLEEQIKAEGRRIRMIQKGQRVRKAQKMSISELNGVLSTFERFMNSHYGPGTSNYDAIVNAFINDDYWILSSQNPDGTPATGPEMSMQGLQTVRAAKEAIISGFEKFVTERDIDLEDPVIFNRCVSYIKDYVNNYIDTIANAVYTWIQTNFY